MKNKTILTMLLMLSIVTLSGCTDKSEQISIPTNLITDDDKGEVIKISENTENLFKEYSDDIARSIIKNRHINERSDDIAWKI